jgi:hypothetical protein
VGRLMDYREVRPPWFSLWHPAKRTRRFEGSIRVEQTLWPQQPELSTLTFEWEEGGLLGGPDYAFYVGRPFLWLLQRRPGGRVGSNYPGRIEPMDSRETVQGLIRNLGTEKDDTPAISAVRRALVKQLKTPR